MEYTYDTFVYKEDERSRERKERRVDTTTNFLEVEALIHNYIKDNGSFDGFVKVSANGDSVYETILKNEADFDDWRIALERSFAWMAQHPTWRPMDNLLEDSPPSEPMTATDVLGATQAEVDAMAARINDAFSNKSLIEQPKDHINPLHYQSFFGIEEELQWLETVQYTKQFRNPEVFKAAVELQARKYLDRLGGKDAEAQEIKKSIWYLEFLAAYIANGNKPIRVKDIPKLLKKG